MLSSRTVSERSPLIKKEESKPPFSPICAIKQTGTFSVGGGLFSYIFMAIMGLVGLGFFFSQQIGRETLELDSGGGLVAVDIVSGIVCLIMFSVYSATLFPAGYHLWKKWYKKRFSDEEDEDDEEKQLKLSKRSTKTEDDTEEKEAATSKKMSKKTYNFLKYSLGASSLIALGSIGISAYLGDMEYAKWAIEKGWFSSASEMYFQAFAGTAGFCLGIAFLVFAYTPFKEHLKEARNTWPEQIENIKDFFCNLSPSRFKNQCIDTFRNFSSNDLKSFVSSITFDKIKRNIVRYGRFIAVPGAVLSFSGFKFYSTKEALELLGVTSKPILRVAGILTFLALTEFTFFTTGMAINTKARMYADDSFPPSAPIRWPIGRKIGWGLGGIVALFMAASAFVGLLYVFTGSIKLPNSIPLTLFISACAICRFIDFMAYSAGSAADTFGGQPFRGYTDNGVIDYYLGKLSRRSHRHHPLEEVIVSDSYEPTPRSPHHHHPLKEVIVSDSYEPISMSPLFMKFEEHENFPKSHSRQNSDVPHNSPEANGSPKPMRR